MRNAKVVLDIYQKRGAKGLPLERVYRHLFDPELFLAAYGKIYRNEGAMTKGTTKETVDGMDLQRIHNIIGLLKMERYKWTPVRRTEIPKANGKTRPLGIPTWSDKLVQEVLRMLLESYYEQKFSGHSHGFRPKRGCHTALLEVRKTWTGTVWFIEGDIKGCFDNIDHTILLEIIRRDIHDGRLISLLNGLLEAGYMKGWKYYDTTGGTPQGGIISPLLANIYMNELDRFVEDTLSPGYTRGKERKANPEYARITKRIMTLEKQEEVDAKEILKLRRKRRQVMSSSPVDPGYRRLKYIRYADDFLLGFVGPKNEAEEIRRRIGEFLEQRLRLNLSQEKTLITHAADDKARFLGYEITVSRAGDKLSDEGKRTANGKITLLMPQRVVREYLARYSKGGKVTHRPELMSNSVYTIIQQYQSVLRGLYNYYCLATNVGNNARMTRIRWILETSLTKTLASKLRCRVTSIYRRFRIVVDGRKMLQTTVQREGKKPLIATFGGIPLVRKPLGMGIVDFEFNQTWFGPCGRRSEIVQRMMANSCELCGVKDVSVQVHHIRKLADIDRPGQRPRAEWERIMSARKRKTLVVCKKCHDDIHAGRHDGTKL